MIKRGFTVIELTAVVSTIAVLAATLFPVFARARESARRSSCASNLAQIGVALGLYAQIYDGRYPPENNEFGPLLPYADLDIFYCQNDSAERYWDMKRARSPRASTFGEDVGTPVRTYSSYVYRGGLTTEDRADTPIAGEARLFHTFAANVLYLGGHVRVVPAELYAPVVEPTRQPVERTSGAQANPTAPMPAPGPPPSQR